LAGGGSGSSIKKLREVFGTTGSPGHEALPLTNTDRDVHLKADPPKYIFHAPIFTPYAIAEISSEKS